ncbi:hypothetical protein [Oceanobacillus kapialis]|uniref:DUF2508 family protein n=1 Tax=Oceanobacillus kapialis TaxID=481353 RepID=A0ABW5Q084_9BACI
MEELLSEYQNDWAYLIPKMNLLEKQNQRYKQALMDIGNNPYDLRENMVKRARRALEESQ